MEFKDYYKILGVKEDADDKEIKAAYRKLARKYHPDVNAEKGAEDKFKEVAEAYQVLKDTKRRAEFDDLRKYGSRSSQGFQPPPGWQQTRGGRQHQHNQNSGDYSEFFNSIFGGRGQGFGQRDNMRQAPTKGQDVELEVPVFLEDTLSDNSKAVEYTIPGSSRSNANNIHKKLKVTIPQGVTDGEKIRVKGQGKPSSNSGVSGDLYLNIRIVPHPLFVVQGHDLLLTLPIAPWEAVLGAKIKIPTLEGSISVTMTPNSQSGKKLRLKGKGLKSKTMTGDLYAELKIVIPPTANEKAKEHWLALSELNNFDPREEWNANK